MSDGIHYTDRYGGPANWPDPATVCPGWCEGTGVIPMRRDDGDLADYRDEWDRLERENPTARPFRLRTPTDALPYHFVKCRDCNGTGRRTDA